MKTRFLTLAALLASSTSAYAVGLDRSGQPIDILFRDGNRVELSLGFTDPSLSGTELTGQSTGNVGDTFLVWGAGVKFDVGDRWSFSISSDEPYGADTFYENDPTTSLLGGTGATVDSNAITALARYRFNDNWSVHGGVRYQEVSAVVTVDGIAFNDSVLDASPGGVGSYIGSFGSDGDFGGVIGVSYEIPSIALRVSLTYSSSTTHDLPTTEVFVPNILTPFGGVDLAAFTLNSAAGATTEVETPESVRLDFQTGIAPDTLLFGSLRWANYGQTVVSPAVFSGATGSPLTDLETGYDFSIGVGRRFNEKWSGSVSAGFTTVGDDALVSPLGPNNGSRFVAVGAKYDVNDQFAISGGVRYTLLGSALAAPGGTAAADFDDNSAISAGLRFEYQF